MREALMKTNVYNLGDIQFQALNEWNYEIGNKFLDWFESLDIPENSYLIQSGDMTEKDTNPGDVVRQLERFFTICSKKFVKSYILVGNHDYKIYHGKRQISFAFAEEKGKIEIVKSIQNIEIDGMNILAMPHLVLKHNTLHDYYNSLTKEKYLSFIKNNKTSYDLCVGHYQIMGDKNGPDWIKDGVDIENIPANKFWLGHIHNRPNKEYLGSAWPLKVSEEFCKYPRIIGIMTKENNDISYEEKEIPIFCSYDTITYPEPFEKPNDKLIHIYTVDNCKNIKIAQDFYKGIYIRATGTIDKEDTTNTSSSEDDFTFKNNVEAFQKFMDEMKPKINRNVIRIVTNRLK